MASTTGVLVVGSGPIGAAVVRASVEAGLDVAMVDSGSAVTDPPGSHLRNGEPFRSRPDAYFADLEPYLDTPDVDLPGAQTTTAVGGQGVLWTNNCPRTVPGLERWPGIEADEWDRLYRVAERYLGVTTEPEASARQRNLRARLESTLASGRAVVDQPFAGDGDPRHPHYVAPADVVQPVADGFEHRRGSVERVTLESDRATGVVVDGAEIESDHVVIAAGAIGTPALLHRSGVRPSALGRGATYHELLMVQVVLDERLTPASTAGDPRVRLMVPPSATRPWHTMVLRDTNPMVPLGPDEDVSEHRLVEIQAFCPLDVSEDSVMEVDPVRFRIPRRPADAERMIRCGADVAAIVESLGRARAGCGPTWMPPGAHLMGTARMAADPSTSVADLHGRVHGVENLWLASVGLIPTRVAVNPTLTGVALGVRTAQHIAARH